MVESFVLMKIVLDQTARLHVIKVTVSQVPYNASAKLKADSHRPFGLEMIHIVKVSLFSISYIINYGEWGTFYRL